MTHSFEINLNTSLEQLGKKEWATALLTIEQNFRLIPADETSFGDELISTLWALHEAKLKDDDLPLVHVFAIRISKFDAWTFRFSKLTPVGKEFLNPLTASHSEFTDSVEVSQSSSAYPAEDIIKRWVRDHLA
jgi:hypothetical protein